MPETRSAEDDYCINWPMAAAGLSNILGEERSVISFQWSRISSKEEKVSLLEVVYSLLVAQLQWGHARAPDSNSPPEMPTLSDHGNPTAGTQIPVSVYPKRPMALSLCRAGSSCGTEDIHFNIVLCTFMP